MNDPSCVFRRARPGDAPSICDLYADAYGGSIPDRTSQREVARQRYPFPQFLDEAWVEDAVQQAAVIWAVAERAGRVVATAGALRNIGTEYDRVSEVFGIVVNQAQRGGGVGTRILKYLCDELASQSAFILCEARTAEQAAWRVSQKSGFTPIGFEPFAHHTTVGSESMLMTAKLVPQGDQVRRPAPNASADIEGLATLILHAVQQADPAGNKGWSPPAFQSGGRSGLPEDDMLSQSSFRSHPELAAVPQIHRREAIVSRDDREGAQTLQQWPAVAGYPGGVIGLNRLEGEDPRRYEHRFYVCRFRASIIAAARVSWDHVDQRARILDLKTAYEGLQEVLVPALVAELIKAAGNDPLSVVVDVRADAIKLQNTLGQLQFHPSVYYPAFVGDADDRHDVVQFVRLHQHSSVDSLRGLECLSTWNNDWPLARRLALIVIEGIATLRVVPVRE